MGIEGAGGVDEDAARFQTAPDVAHDFALQMPAVVHILQAPFCDGSIVLAEHAFARARHIGENHVELKLRLLVVTWIIVGDNHIRMTEFLNVLGKNLRTGAHRFVAEEQTAFWQRCTHGSGFSARSCTEIEHHHGFVNQLANHQVNEHG